MKKLFLPVPLLFLLALLGQAQVVSIVNKKFIVNGNTSCPIYFNGANTPWENWNDFGGSYNSKTWTQDLVNLKNKGINSTRIWFSCDGNGQPSVAADGTVSAPTQAFWDNCDDLFKNAQANGIYIYATMMSFDHTKKANAKSTNWQNMMNSAAKTQTFVDNYLVPFVNRYKTNPYLWAIDLCNEIEWIAENTASTPNIKTADINWGCSYAVLQRYVAICTAGLHQASVARSDGSKVLLTLGSASVKWNGMKLPNGGNNSNGNKWSDANLQAQNSNNSASYLDFYSPHFYGWMESSFSSPFEKTPAQYGMDDKACIVAEMPARDPMPTPAMTLITAFNNLKNGGWQGHMPWTANITSNLNTEVGDLDDFGAAAQTFATNNSVIVKPSCSVSTCSTAAPIVTASINYCVGDVSKSLTATGTALKWYPIATGGAVIATAPIPLTTETGTTNYYVSQTLGNCEGPRALIAVTVNGRPSITITSPINNAIINKATLSISTTTTGTGISKVEFFNGEVKLGEDASSPYSYNWTDITNGTYELTTKVTNTSNCVDSAKVTVQISFSTGIEGDENSENAWSIYPNPFSENVTIESKEPFEYTLFDLKGATVEKSVTANTLVKPGSNLPSGIYVLKITSKQGSHFVKLKKN